MIIFDLDGTLADCSHRRHFVVNPYEEDGHAPICTCGDPDYEYPCEADGWANWKPDWKSFYEACDKDIPIEPVVEILRTLWWKEGFDIQIWSGRCESVREKTENWLYHNIFRESELPVLKMRPIGDNTPGDELKERWLDEHLDAPLYPTLEKATPENEGKVIYRKSPIEYVFDSNPKSIEMWRRRGIFVFNCNQNDEEF